jgi:hypothetical protein
MCNLYPSYVDLYLIVEVLVRGIISIVETIIASFHSPHLIDFFSQFCIFINISCTYGLETVIQRHWSISNVEFVYL